MPLHAIALSSVTKRFGTHVVLDAVDMHFREGAVHGFLGANGAGKTTTLRLLLGLLRADSGDVRVLGIDPATRGEEVRSRVGVLLDHDGHYDRLTALQNLEFHAGIRGIDRRAARLAVEPHLKAVGLWERRGERVATFSKGMRQKLAVVRTLLGSPRLLLLDEPFTGLDPAAAVDLRDRLRLLAKKEGMTILLTTHDLHHAEKICDAVIMLERGRVVTTGALATWGQGDPNGEEAVLVVASNLTDDVLSALVSDGIVSTHRRLAPDRTLLQCPSTKRRSLATELVKRGVEVVELHRHRETLEETFMKVIAPGSVETGSSS